MSAPQNALRNALDHAARNAARNASGFGIAALCFLCAAFASAPAPAFALFASDSSSSAKPETRGPKVASDGAGMRRVRRAALGVAAAGQLGVGGAQLELCLSPATSFMGGFGGGFAGAAPFQSFSLGLKRFFGGERILPYAAAGFARWSNGGRPDGAISESTPSFLADSFMSDEQKRTGLVSQNLVYGSAGFQFASPDGPWAGHALFVELVGLADAARLRFSPTGSFGYLYYF